MRRTIATVCVVVGLGALISAAPAPKPRPTIPQKLAQRVDFEGINDPQETLGEVLKKLSKQYGIEFEFNEEAFKAANIRKVDQTSIIAGTLPIPAMKHVRLSEVLLRILWRVSMSSRFVYLVRADHIEITTANFLRAEVWGNDYGPHLPLVHAILEDCPLEGALKQLTEQSGYNVVLDKRASKQAKIPVSAKLLNTPLDAALRLLADMADLQCIHLDNVLYVTTRANAAEFHAQESMRNRAKESARNRELHCLLGLSVKHDGFPDPKTTLQEALEQLAKRYNLSFDINELAFKEANIKEVGKTEIATPDPFPAMHSRLETILKRILSRVSPSATYLIRDDVIEITTAQAIHREFFADRPNGPFPPLVSGTFEKASLAAALKELAHAGNVVLDSRLAKEGQMAVTADFMNLPLDTAVQMLADMAGLKVVPLDDTLYVTKKENARLLLEEQAKLRLPRQREKKESANGPFLPRVSGTFVNRSLETALKELAHWGNIVLDNKLAKEGQTPVTADFVNVPLDTAVQMLAGMAGLQVVPLDNVLYVTNKENANILMKEQEKLRQQRPHEKKESTDKTSEKNNSKSETR